MYWVRLLFSGFISLASVFPLSAEQFQLLVTVFDRKTGSPIQNLQENNFSVVDDTKVLQVVSAEYKSDPVDVVLLVDTSMLGGLVRPLLIPFVKGLGRDERMSIVEFHDSASLLQDFTNDRKILSSSLRGLSYANNPRILDALFATLDGDLGAASEYRRVIILLASGVEGHSKTPLLDVLSLARETGTSIYPVYVGSVEKRLFKHLADQTGGAHFRVRLKKEDPETLAKNVYSLLRSYYVLNLTGSYTLGGQLTVKVKGDSKPRLRVSTFIHM